MMKKVLMVGALVLASVTSANAIGLGAVFGGGGGWTGGGNWGAGFSLGLGDLDAVTWEFALRASAGNRYFNIAIDADMHVFQHIFTDWVAFYIGVGPYVGLTIRSAAAGYDPQWNDKDKKNSWNNNHRFGGGFGIDVGARVPIGFRFMLIDHLDIWLALVPSLGIYLGLGDYYMKNRFGIGGGWGGELGIRWWL
jgi:hypothetical protein